MIQEAWRAIPAHFNDVGLDVFVVMPNHVHGVVHINEAQSTVVPQHAGALRKAPSLSTVVRSFKAAVTRELRLRSLHGDTPVWQPNFYDRVVRNEAEIDRVREYIAANPIAWSHDYENLERSPNDEYERAWAWLERQVGDFRSWDTTTPAGLLATPSRS